jgi:ketosteroid isomerase-like protein
LSYTGGVPSVSRVAEDAKTVVERWHIAWAGKDFDTGRRLLHDDLSFRGPIDTFDNADDYLAALQRLAGMVASVDLQRTVAEGDQVVLMLELETPMGRSPVAEWYRVRDGKIAEVQVYFDARPFAPPS